MLGVVVLLLLLIGVTVLHGDQVGVQVLQAEPTGQAHSTNPVTIRFSEMMDPSSVAAHFHTDPPLQGTFRWDGTTLTFQPAPAWRPNSTYTISLEPGALSANGRPLLTEYHYRFNVMPLRIAYLYPADAALPNLRMVSMDDPSHPRQLTQSETGVSDISVSPDGTQIAFSELDPAFGESNIEQIDLDTGTQTELTQCQFVSCFAPVWRPQNNMLSYEQNSLDKQLGYSAPRLWLLDLSTSPPATHLLLPTSQVLGFDAHWSADGDRVAMADGGSGAILVYDFAMQKTYSIGQQSGTSGALSPDGTQLVYPQAEANGRIVLYRTVLASGQTTRISDSNSQDDDTFAQWSPNGTQVAFTRTHGSLKSAQILLLDLKTNQMKTLIDDPRYTDVKFWWDPTGTQLLIQRYGALDENLRPDPQAQMELWIDDLKSGSLRLIEANAFSPSWVP